jgi:hypothetical protein
MTRFHRPTVFLIAWVALTIGCGDGGSDGGGEAGRAAIADETAAEVPGRPAIPPEGPEAVEGLKIEPYFDREGTRTELAVAPGELFEVYVCATHPKYLMTTAQWRLEVPDGINVAGEAKMFPESLMIGNYNEVFVITYPCQAADSLYAILKYACVATEAFSGGEFKTVKTRPRNPGADWPFIGFVNCGEDQEQIPAYGGTATVTRK